MYPGAQTGMQTGMTGAMEDAGILELLAELAVGILGFSGIVAALQREVGAR